MLAHRDDEGEVDADSEVGDGQHFGGSKLDVLGGLDEALQVALCPAAGDHQILHR